ncbi:MAG: AMP-binding protein [Bacteroidales bacterium]|nr:AMP-binding protein [Bacteroidales bacterium]
MNETIPGIIINNKIVPIEDISSFIANELARPGIRKWEQKIYQFIDTFFDSSEYIDQDTSGTSGTPKLIRLSKKAMITSAIKSLDYLKIPPAANSLLCLPIDYIAGKMVVVRSIVGQLNMLYTEPIGMPVLNGKQNIKLCSMVPMQAFNLFSNYELLQSLDTLLIGGAEIRPELEGMLQNLSINVYETFGMAETCSHIALRRISGSNREKSFTLLPNVSISTDKRSCLIIETDYLDETVYTNDIVEILDEKHFIWKGRFDNLINSGGKKIHPEVLESQLERELFFPVAIIGVDDPVLGSKLVLVTEKKNCPNTDDLLVKLNEILPKHQVPKSISLVDEMPRNKSFKIDRNKLKDLVATD